MRGLALASLVFAALGPAPSLARGVLGPNQGQLEDQRFAAGEAVRLLVSFDHPPTASDAARVAGVGGEITHRWTGVVWAIAADLTRSQALALLAVDEHILFIEPSRATVSTVAFAARQIGQRGAWGPSPDRRFTGAGEVVAVVDGGLDASHADLAGRVVAWADFVGADVDRAGDLYPRALDADGHGTAVGGMMAGRGLGAANGAIPVSWHARFDGRIGWCQDAPVPLAPTAGGTLVAQLRPQNAAARYNLTWRRYVDGGRGTNAGNEELAARMGQGNGRFEFDLAGRQGYGHYLCAFPQDAGTAGSSAEMHADVPWPSPDGQPLTAGMAPDASLVGLKVGDDRGRGNSCTHIDGYEWLYQRGVATGVGVVNISRTVNGGATVLTEDAAVNNLVREKGILFVTTPGNGWNANPQVDRVGSPGSAKEAITVGSVTAWDERAAYSQPGRPDQSVRKPDVLAPGGVFRAPLLLPDANTAACAQPPCAAGTDPFPDDYRTWDGTSFAAPLVAGVLAQLLEADGGVQHTYDQVLRLRGLLQMTSTPIDAAQPGTPADALRRDPEYFQGFGRINPQAALDATSRELSAGEPVVVQLGGEVGDARILARRIPLRTDEPLVIRVAPRTGDVAFEVRLYDAAVAETPTQPNRRVMACGGDDPAAPPPQAVAAVPTLLARALVPAVDAPCACTCAGDAPARRCTGALDAERAATHCPEACAAVGRDWAGNFSCDPADVAACSGPAACVCDCAAEAPVAACTAALGPAEVASQCPAVCAARGRGWTGEHRCDGACAAGAALFYQPPAAGTAILVVRRLGGAGVLEASLERALPICDPLAATSLVGAPCAVGAGRCRSEGRLVCPPGQRAECDAPAVGVPERCDGREDDDCDGRVDEGCALDAGLPPDAGSVDAALADARIVDAVAPDFQSVDARPVDAQPLDAQPVDAQPVDAQPVDARRPDAQPEDGALVDALVTDALLGDAARRDAETRDARPPDMQLPPTTDIGADEPQALADGGCDCQAVDHGASPLLWGLLIPAMRRRRRAGLGRSSH